MNNVLLTALHEKLENLIEIEQEKLDDNLQGAKGEIIIEGVKVHLLVLLPRIFPSALPKFYLIPVHAFGRIPHVSDDGSICFQDPSSIWLNSDFPEQIIEESFLQCVSVLRSGARGENKGDFIDEFEYYWMQNCHGLVDMYGEKRPTFVTKMMVASGENLSVFFHESDVWNTKAIESKSFKHGIFIPISIPVQPPPKSEPWNTNKIQEIIKTINPKNQKRLKRILKSYPDVTLLVFSMSIGVGGDILFAVEYNQNRPQNKNNDPVRQFKIQRKDSEYLKPRGGTSTTLSEKNVLLVGCGSVGGYIADTLIASGLGKLTVLDNDKMEDENMFRHFLGKLAVGCPKTHALKNFLEYKYPFTKITPFQQDISDAKIEYRNFDLVIIAVGDPTIELWLNHQIKENSKTTSCIHTWIEPYGIGGHSLLSVNGKKGCFKCLFMEPERGCSASFVEPGKVLSKKSAGCCSRYSVYGAIDAQQTALQTSRLALSYLHERERDSIILSWKGDDSLLRENGGKSNARYRMSNEELYAKRRDFDNPNCSICGNL